MNAPSRYLGTSFPLNVGTVNFCMFKMPMWIAGIAS